jgi:hypothetical protein
MKDEALKLALDALENSVDLVREDAYNAEKLYGNYPSRQGKVAGLKVLADDHEKAITAINQALAQPVQEPVAWISAVTGDVTTQDMSHTASWVPLTTPPAAKTAQKQDFDDAAVDCFAEAMKEKMANQRAKGYTGWDNSEQCPTERLQTMLSIHVAKGDPVDVGNLAMMLWHRNESTATPPAAQRQWVGLTNDEVNNFAAGCHLGSSVQGAIYKAEAKLKDKNNG